MDGMIHPGLSAERPGTVRNNSVRCSMKILVGYLSIVAKSINSSPVRVRKLPCHKDFRVGVTSLQTSTQRPVARATAPRHVLVPHRSLDSAWGVATSVLPALRHAP